MHKGYMTLWIFTHVMIILKPIRLQIIMFKTCRSRERLIKLG